MPVDAFIHVVSDRCLTASDDAEQDQVRAAERALDGLRAVTAKLQDELQHAPSMQKPEILRMIRQLRTEEIPPAVAELDAARQALAVRRLELSGRVVTPAFHSL